MASRTKSADGRTSPASSSFTGGGSHYPEWRGPRPSHREALRWVTEELQVGQLVSQVRLARALNYHPHSLSHWARHRAFRRWWRYAVLTWLRWLVREVPSNVEPKALARPAVMAARALHLFDSDLTRCMREALDVASEVLHPGGGDAERGASQAFDGGPDVVDREQRLFVIVD